ncbi:MAG: hypothetical protein KDE27_09540 [Planctomycetes bacterium]|nr:hypothetical protein [Planctomycetota bacterium]
MTRLIPMACIALATTLLLAATAPAQGIALRGGEIVIGSVVNVKASTVEIAVTFPRVETRVLDRSDIKPSSMYAILSGRLDQTSGKAHLELAQTCRELGLFAFGIAEAREAARRDPALAEASQHLVEGLRQSIADEILHAATSDADAGRYGSASLAAEAILRDYADTPAARAARDLLAKLRSLAATDARIVGEKEAVAATKRIRRALDRSTEDLAAPAHGKMRDQRRLQRGIARLEKVWKGVHDLVGPEDAAAASTSTSAPGAADRLAAAQTQLQSRLTAAYLALGQIYLEREALSDASEWCNKACEIDPQNKDSHQLHSLILQAKIISGAGY